jgi:hypothetical protein
MDYVTIGFSRPRGGFQPFSWLIRLVDKTPYSHTYICFHSDMYDRDLVYQASSLQVNFEGWALFNSTDLTVKEFILPVSPSTKTKIIQFAIDRAGIPYGWKEILGIGIVKFVALFGKRIANPFKSGDTTYICSKLVSEILIDYLGDNIRGDLESLTPKDVYKYLSTITP